MATRGVKRFLKSSEKDLFYLIQKTKLNIINKQFDANHED